MKKFIAIFASALLISSMFITSASAIDNSQIINGTVLNSGGGMYEQCFREGNPGCRE